MLIIPTSLDDPGLRQVFQLGERDVGPVFTWPQFGFGSRRRLFHSAPVYPKTCFLAFVGRLACYSVYNCLICSSRYYTKNNTGFRFIRILSVNVPSR